MSILLIFVFCHRFSSDDPLWQEVAKRYQQILEKECKLLGQFPVYYDGQMIPSKTPVARTVKAASSRIEGTTEKDRPYARGQGQGASKCKSKEKGTETCNIPRKDHADISIVTENMKDDNLPKIVEVYSLNSQMELSNVVNANQKKNGQKSGQKRNNQGVFSCNNEEMSKMNGDMCTPRTSKNAVIQDSNLSTLSPEVKPHLVSDNFIDLTIGDEEEAESCSVHDGATSSESCSKENLNADNQREFGQSKDETGDNGREKKSNQRKRKGVFGRKKKGKTRRLAQNQQSIATESSNTSSFRSGCNSNSIIEDDTDKNPCVNDHEIIYHEKCKQSLNDQNNNDWRKEEEPGKITKEDINVTKEYWSRSSANSGVHISLDMTYRENKITTLKARLAKQEEELAKLKTQKESKLTNGRNLEVPLQDVRQKGKESHANNLSIRGHDTQEEADPAEVNLDVICRHVIKSFDIFNARQKDKKRGKDGFHTLHEKNTCVTEKANGRKSDLNYLHYQPQGRQEEFLFQVGLRRSLIDT